MPRHEMHSLYDEHGVPCPRFNRHVKAWLRGEIPVREHKPPAAFAGLLTHYDAKAKALRLADPHATTLQVHRRMLSMLTEIMNGCDLTGELTSRLPDARINAGGGRSTLSQGLMKNSGENFVNAIVYALADCLQEQDEVLVDKGLPPPLRSKMTMVREFVGTKERRELELVVESDFCIFARSNPLNAIVCNAKTRLKEVFHIGTMWKLFFDMLDDDHCQKKWGLRAVGDTSQMHYVFATADNIREGGTNSQGPDLKPEGVRNLLALDASFFDYVFVSKTGLGYVSTSLANADERETLFHELGCITDLMLLKYPALQT
jgi:hypothetical protein